MGENPLIALDSSGTVVAETHQGRVRASFFLLSSLIQI
jgi:hypothetical protein